MMKHRATIWQFSFILLVLSVIVLTTSCKKDEPEEPPVVETLEVASVGLNSFNATGVILESGSSPVSQHGFCWATFGTPVFGTDSCILLGPAADTGEFSIKIEGLDDNTTYYVRAYAENDAGLSYGTEIAVITGKLENAPTVVPAKE
jgi:hypothetical protein